MTAETERDKELLERAFDELRDVGGADPELLDEIAVWLGRPERTTTEDFRLVKEVRDEAGILYDHVTYALDPELKHAFEEKGEQVIIPIKKARHPRKLNITVLD